MKKVMIASGLCLFLAEGMLLSQDPNVPVDPNASDPNSGPCRVEDFRLMPDSPAIHAGAWTPYLDRDGYPMDDTMGAYAPPGAVKPTPAVGTITWTGRSAGYGYDATWDYPINWQPYGFTSLASNVVFPDEPNFPYQGGGPTTQPVVIANLTVGKNYGFRFPQSFDPNASDPNKASYKVGLAGVSILGTTLLKPFSVISDGNHLGKVTILQSGRILSGNFSGSVDSNGIISGGTYKGPIKLLGGGWKIRGGAFSGADMVVNSDGEIASDDGDIDISEPIILNKGKLTIRKGTYSLSLPYPFPGTGGGSLVIVGKMDSITWKQPFGTMTGPGRLR